MEVLRAIEGEEPVYEPGPRRITLTAQRGSQTLVDVVRRFDEAGITLEDISLRQPTLDDVFLTLTGHVAEDAPKPNGEADSGGRRRRGRRGR